MLCKNCLVCQQFLVGFIERLIQVKTICSIKWKLSNKKMSSNNYKMSYLIAVIAAIIFLEVCYICILVDEQLINLVRLKAKKKIKSQTAAWLSNLYIWKRIHGKIKSFSESQPARHPLGTASFLCLMLCFSEISFLF